MKTKKSFFTIVVIFNLIFVSSCVPNSNKSKENQKPSQETNTEIINKSDGITTYQSTLSNQLWVKLELNENNKTYRYWVTIPSSGNWGDIKYEGTFKYEETRGSDDGQLLKVYRLSHGEEHPMEYDLLIMSQKIGAEFAMSANPNSGRLTANQTEANPWQ
jgi:hypothetical protein